MKKIIFLVSLIITTTMLFGCQQREINNSTNSNNEVESETQNENKNESKLIDENLSIKEVRYVEMTIASLTKYKTTNKTLINECIKEINNIEVIEEISKEELNVIVDVGGCIVFTLEDNSEIIVDFPFFENMVINNDKYYKIKPNESLYKVFENIKTNNEK